MIFVEVLNTNVMGHMMELVAMHSWNNLLHIKTMEIWDCILKSSLTPEQKLEAIKKSDAIKVIVDISETANASFTSSR